MGFASCLENNSERNNGAVPDFPIWSPYDGPTHWGSSSESGLDSSSVSYPPVEWLPRSDNTIDRACRFIERCKGIFDAQNQSAQNPSPRRAWEKHYGQVVALHGILSEVSSVPNTDPTAWELLRHIEQRLKSFFQENQEYGPISRDVFEQVVATSRDLQSRSRVIQQDLEEFQRRVPRNPDDSADKRLVAAVKQFGGNP